MATIHECNGTLREVNLQSCWPVYSKKVLVYHPSNSTKGFAIKGTNLRVSFKYI